MATIIPAVIPTQTSTIQVFQGRATSSQTLTTANTPYPIALAGEDFDDLNGHSNTSRYTVQKAGLYLVYGSIVYSAQTAGARVAVIYKNGFQYPGAIGWGNTAGSVLTVSVLPTLMNLAVNDYVELYGISALASTTTVYDVNNWCQFRVDFIR